MRGCGVLFSALSADTEVDDGADDEGENCEATYGTTYYGPNGCAGAFRW